MGASITLAGESLIAQKHADETVLHVERFFLANVPGLDTAAAVDRAAGLPDAGLIVHQAPVMRRGVLAANQVVYSLLMGTDIGDFDFNWIGLTTDEGVLLVVAYVPLQQKRREIQPFQTGNALTRNIVVQFDGAQSLTGISVPAETWQYDWTSQLTEKLDRSVLAGGTKDQVAMATGDDAAPVNWAEAGEIAAAALFRDAPFSAKTGARYYLASDAAEATLPAVVDLLPGSTVGFIKAQAAIQPLIKADGELGETVTHNGLADTGFYLDINAEVVVVWNGGGWEV